MTVLSDITRQKLRNLMDQTHPAFDEKIMRAAVAYIAYEDEFEEAVGVMFNYTAESYRIASGGRDPLQDDELRVIMNALVDKAIADRVNEMYAIDEAEDDEDEDDGA